MENYIHHLLINNLYIFIFVVVLVERVRRSAFGNLYTAWLFYLLGTFLHELSHFIVSLITNGKPISFSIVPTKQGNSYIFGRVLSSNTLAPLLILPMVYVVDMYYFYFFKDTLYTQLFYIFLIVILIDNSIPSTTDFRIAFSGYSYIFWLFLLCLYIYVEVMK